MAINLGEYLAACRRSRQFQSELFAKKQESLEQWARSLLAGMRQVWPGTLYACLFAENYVQSGVIDEQGRSRPDWMTYLNPRLLPLFEKAGAEQSPAVTGLAQELGLKGQVLLAQPIQSKGRYLGVVALAISEKKRVSEGEAVTELLAGWAEKIAWHLLPKGDSLSSEEKARQEMLLKVAEVTSIVAHEFNNFLNGMLLHVAMMEQQDADKSSPELGVIRKLGNNAARLVSNLQQFNRRERLVLKATDLNLIIRETVDRISISRPSLRIKLTLAPAMPPVLANEKDLQRLLLLLLENSIDACEATQAEIEVGTELREGKIAVWISDTGPPIDPDLLPKLFDPFVLARPGAKQPGLGICKTMARHLQGSIYGGNRPDGGVEFVVELKPAGPMSD